MHNDMGVNINQDASEEARIIFPSQIIGIVEAAQILGMERSTLTRRLLSGNIVPLAKIGGPRGAYIFDRADVQALAQAVP